MNHIFYTQNNISHSIILQVIELLNIPKYQCTIIHSPNVLAKDKFINYLNSDRLKVKTYGWLPKSWECLKKKNQN